MAGMNAYPCEAVVLRRTRYSETSLIVALMTRAYGRVDALAKGCRRPKSRLAGHLDLLTWEEVTLLARPRAGLELLTDAAWIQDWPGLRRRPVAYAGGCVLAEVVLRTCMEGDPHPEVFAALTETLTELDRGEPPAAVVTAGLLRILRGIGLAPRLDACARCGATVEPTAVAWTREGVACLACDGALDDGADGGDGSEDGGRGREPAPPLSPRLLQTLRYLEQTPLARAGRLGLTGEERRALLEFMASHLRETLERDNRAFGLFRALAARAEADRAGRKRSTRCASERRRPRTKGSHAAS